MLLLLGGNAKDRLRRFVRADGRQAIGRGVHREVHIWERALRP